MAELQAVGKSITSPVLMDQHFAKDLIKGVGDREVARYELVQLYNKARTYFIKNS